MLSDMKRFLFISLLVVVLCGCTQNDGHIGPWFGSWHLESMLIDGETDDTYADLQAEDKMQVMVSFQGKVFNMGYIGGSEIYGSWSYAGETLTLVANYNAGSGYNSPNFNPYPIVMHFPRGIEQLEITVTAINSRTMQWQHIDPEGRLITYNFRKYP